MRSVNVPLTSTDHVCHFLVAAEEIRSTDEDNVTTIVVQSVYNVVRCAFLYFIFIAIKSSPEVALTTLA